MASRPRKTCVLPAQTFYLFRAPSTGQRWIFQFFKTNLSSVREALAGAGAAGMSNNTIDHPPLALASISFILPTVLHGGCCSHFTDGAPETH